MDFVVNSEIIDAGIDLLSQVLVFGVVGGVLIMVLSYLFIVFIKFIYKVIS